MNQTASVLTLAAITMMFAGCEKHHVTGTWNLEREGYTEYHHFDPSGDWHGEFIYEDKGKKEYSYSGTWQVSSDELILVENLGFFGSNEYKFSIETVGNGIMKTSRNGVIEIWKR